MKEYHKIQTMWKRQSEKPHGIIVGQYALPEFEYLADKEWVATEKVDGTNIRVCWDGHRVSFAGKTDNAQIPSHLVNRLNELFGGEANEQVFEQVFGNAEVCLYGEGFGEKIQKGGGNYTTGQEFILFDVMIDGWWLERHNVVDIASKMGIGVVPELVRGTLQEVSDAVEEGLFSRVAEAHGSDKFIAEGVVAKPVVELRARHGERIITKLKHSDFNNSVEQ